MRKSNVARGSSTPSRSQSSSVQLRSLKIGFQNARGLSGRLPELKKFIHNFNIDIMFVVETWLTPGATNPISKECILDIRNPARRTGRQGHGGLIAIVPDPGLRHWVKPADTGTQIYGAATASVSVGDTFLSICYVEPRKEKDELFEDIITKLDGQQEKHLLIGDMNAHYKIFGSATNNTRGKLLASLIEETNWIYCEPVYGRCSTPNNRPDHLLAKGIEPVALTIYEDFITTSDHAPISFSINVNVTNEMQTCVPKTFERLNIRNIYLEGKKAEFVSMLDNSKNAILSDLEYELENANLTSSAASKIQKIDKVYEKICNWILDAAKTSLGTFKFSSNGRWNDISSPEIEIIKNDLFDYKIAAKNSHGAVQATARTRVKELQAELDLALKKRRSELFRDFADGVEKDGIGAVIKIASCMRTRASRSGCQLEPSKADSYVNYFENTFGGTPIGSKIINTNILKNSNPANISAATGFASSWNSDFISKILASMANGKAAGPDDIVTELLKAKAQQHWVHNENEEIKAHFLDPVPKVLELLFTFIDKLKQPPSIWKIAAVCPVFKGKGSPLEIANYRPISLTSVIRRAFEVQILHEIMPFIERKLNHEQGGFRRGQSTLMQVLSLHEIICANQDGLYAFLDIKAAFDTVNRQFLWTILLEEFQFPPNILIMLRALFDDNKAFLRVIGTESKRFPILRGVLQGSSLSPVLFSCYINSLITRLKQSKYGLSSGTRLSNCLFFADDATIFAKTEKELQTLLDVAIDWAGEHGIEFAPSKCKFISKKPCKVTMSGETLEKVSSYVYLGCTITLDGVDLDADLAKRLPKAKSTLGFLVSKGLNGYGWAPKLCHALYKTFVRPTLDYAQHLRIPANERKRTLELFERNCLRKIFSVAKNTSTGAIQAILGHEGIMARTERLHAQFFERIHHDTRSKVPAVAIYRDKLTTFGASRKSIDCRSLCIAAQNSIPFKDLKRLSEFERRMLAPAALEEKLSSNKKFNEKFIRQYKAQRFRKDLDASSNVGKVHAPFQQLGQMDVLLSPLIGLSNQCRRTLIMWLVGRVCYHQICGNCDNTELSRVHGLACAGALVILDRDRRNLITKLCSKVTEAPDSTQNGLPLNDLDKFLWQIRRAINYTVQTKRNACFYNNLKSALLLAVKVIRLICRRCRHGAASYCDDWGRSKITTDSSETADSVSKPISIDPNPSQSQPNPSHPHPNPSQPHPNPLQPQPNPVQPQPNSQLIGPNLLQPEQEIILDSAENSKRKKRKITPRASANSLIFQQQLKRKNRELDETDLNEQQQPKHQRRSFQLGRPKKKSVKSSQDPG